MQKIFYICFLNMLLTKINDLRSEKIVKKIIFLMAIVVKKEMYTAIIAIRSHSDRKYGDRHIIQAFLEFFLT